MSSSQETSRPESAEIDSEGSSCEDRETTSVRKRLLSSDPESIPKKRRKQSTPIKFSTSVPAPSLGEESEEEARTAAISYENYEHEEGKQAPSPSSKPPGKDENLNNEFRCQYCSQIFEGRVTLEVHLECEHHFAGSHALQQRQPPANNNGDSPQRASPETSAQSSPSPINLSGISIRNFASSAPWLNGQVQMQNDASPLDKIAGRNNNHFPPMPPGFPSHLAQFLPITGFPMPDSTQMQRTTMGQYPKIFNPDAYCDLCNKEFCNKYFLKTHKANKHGIFTDPPVSQNQSNDTTSTSPFVSSSSMSCLSGSMAIKLDQHRIENNGLQQPTIPCDICPKRFKNEDSLRKHRSKIHFNPNNEIGDSSQYQISLPSSSGDDEGQSPGGIESLFKQEYAIDQDDSSFPSTPRPLNMSPQSAPSKESSFNGDRLRRLGVMNPEAFCELCCKEYCNKYFLRTHKFKKHGIFIPEEKSPNSQGAASSWHQIQNSPLNLIMTENLGNGSESEDRSEECACKTCGIRLQGRGLYNMHMEKIHGNRDQLSPKPVPDIDSIDTRTDSISEDLQKLQTMILQLNGLESNKAASCAVCGKDYDTPAALRSHMIAEHNVVPENLSLVTQQLTREKSSPTATIPQSFCAICEKDFQNQEILKKHIAEDHQPSTPTTPQLPQAVPTTPKSNPPSQGERKIVANITPTSSYCEICNKELCNKYFMKTHMQKMHGIEIENGAQIGGVVCNICKKELCSKYFLRVHKQNTHGIIEEGVSTGKQDSFEAPPPVEDNALKPEQLGDLNLRYITHFTEVCPICNRRFRSPKWLKVHLQSEHGKAGIEKWREIEAYHQTLPKIPSRVPSASKNNQQQQPQGNISLKIPNGLEPNQQIRASDLAALGTQVLSSLFGAAADDQSRQIYQCTQCNFSTSVLSLHFFHERSHHQQQENIDNEQRMNQCPICAQSFAQPEMLRQHMLTRHPNPFPHLFSQFPLPLLNDYGNDQQTQHQERNDYSDSPKEDLRQSPQITNDTEIMMKKGDGNMVQVLPQGAYQCAQCGIASINLNRIKKHVRREHKSQGDPMEAAISELSKTLKDVANKHKVPASYAIPQDSNLTPDKTIMQAFVIEEQLDGLQHNNGTEESNMNGQTTNGRFAPVLVFLPVKTRMNGATTITFKLNPA